MDNGSNYWNGGWNATDSGSNNGMDDRMQRTVDQIMECNGQWNATDSGSNNLMDDAMQRTVDQTMEWMIECN